MKQTHSNSAQSFGKQGDEWSLVRIAHISDSHLGSSLFQLTERKEDARKCLKKAIDMAMQHSPDILVHTGDLFHTPLPQNDDRIFAAKALVYQDDNLKLTSDVPITFEYAYGELTYYIEEDGILNLQLAVAPTTITLNDHLVEQYSYEPATKKLILQLPKGEGKIIIN